jgi:hypothetical protein
MRIGAPWQWYKLDARPSLELLETFVRRTETQIQTGVEDFKQNKASEFYVTSEEERMGQMVDHFDGLDSMSWDLKALFDSHFPNMQRKAAFVTLYSFLEHKLKKLAKKLQRELSIERTLESTKGKGIFKSFTFMEESILLGIGKSATEWIKIFELNRLRNLVTHAEGELSQQLEEKKQQEELIEKLQPYVSIDDDEVVLTADFLNHVLQRFDDFFQYLDRAIQNRFPTKESRMGPPNKRR